MSRIYGAAGLRNRAALSFDVCALVRLLMAERIKLMDEGRGGFIIDANTSLTNDPRVILYLLLGLRPLICCH